jgi:hypothetical protein
MKQAILDWLCEQAKEAPDPAEKEAEWRTKFPEGDS